MPHRSSVSETAIVCWLTLGRLSARRVVDEAPEPSLPPVGLSQVVAISVVIGGVRLGRRTARGKRVEASEIACRMTIGRRAGTSSTPVVEVLGQEAELRAVRTFDKAAYQNTLQLSGITQVDSPVLTRPGLRANNCGLGGRAPTVQTRERSLELGPDPVFGPRPVQAFGPGGSSTGNGRRTAARPYQHRGSGV